MLSANIAHRKVRNRLTLVAWQSHRSSSIDWECRSASSRLSGSWYLLCFLVSRPGSVGTRGGAQSCLQRMRSWFLLRWHRCLSWFHSPVAWRKVLLTGSGSIGFGTGEIGVRIRRSRHRSCPAYIQRRSPLRGSIQISTRKRAYHRKCSSFHARSPTANALIDGDRFPDTRTHTHFFR